MVPIELTALRAEIVERDPADRFAGLRSHERTRLELERRERLPIKQHRDARRRAGFEAQARPRDLDRAVERAQIERSELERWTLDRDDRRGCLRRDDQRERGPRAAAGEEQHRA
jgi:hypothetical protein